MFHQGLCLADELNGSDATSRDENRFSIRMLGSGWGAPVLESLLLQHVASRRTLMGDRPLRVPVRTQLGCRVAGPYFGTEQHSPSISETPIAL